MGFLNQSPFQELFPVLIRNIKDVLYSQLFTVIYKSIGVDLNWREGAQIQRMN